MPNGTTENAGYGAIRFNVANQTLGGAGKTVTLLGDTRIGSNNFSGIIASQITGPFGVEFTTSTAATTTPTYTLSNSANNFNGNVGLNVSGARDIVSILSHEIS